MNNINCSFPSCKFQSTELMTTIDNGTQRITLCPLHIKDYKDDNIDFTPSSIIKPSKCSLCDCTDNIVQFKVQEREKIIKFELCQTHLHKLLNYKLQKEDINTLRNNHGIFLEISNHFYDK